MREKQLNAVVTPIIKIIVQNSIDTPIINYFYYYFFLKYNS